jgi:hypothetical protein
MKILHFNKNVGVIYQVYIISNLAQNLGRKLFR